MGGGRTDKRPDKRSCNFFFSSLSFSLKIHHFFFVRTLFHRVSLTWNYRIYTHIHTVWNFKLFDKSIIGRAKLCRVGGRRVVALGWDSVHFDDLINTESSANWIRVA